MSSRDRGLVCRGLGLGWVLTVLLSPCPQEALPGLIWDLGQQLGDLSLESGGLEQESGRSSGERGGRSSGERGRREQGQPGTPPCFPLSPPPPSLRPLSLSLGLLFAPQSDPLSISPLLPNPGFYEDPSSTGGPDSPPSTFCGDSGFSGSGSYGRLGPSEPRGIYASERPKSLGKVGGVGALRARELAARRWF